jgi:hypothetical protein
MRELIDSDMVEVQVQGVVRVLDDAGLRSRAA